MESCQQGEGNSNKKKVLLFEKVVTPSDVGKLNRLVVPKHFAEKHLPLLGAAARAGTVLCFHDARGATWRFRYSYWGSSQSYVMTKGWSRYVRDKRLAAGDTVSFCRDQQDRLFIDCRRQRFNTKRPGPVSSLIMPAQQPPVVLVDQQQRRVLRLFGVDLELRAAAEPLLLDLHL